MEIIFDATRCNKEILDQVSLIFKISRYFN
jgi:hypothetical protein